MKLFRFSLLVVSVSLNYVLFTNSRAIAQDLLTNEFKSKELTPLGEFNPFPTHADRTFWRNLPDSIQQFYLNRGESLLDHEWPTIPASFFLEFKTIGNRGHFEGFYKARRWDLQCLLFAELIENQGRFLTQIMNVLWLILEESTWCASAHIGAQEIGVDLPDPDQHIVDLYAARTAQLLAWTSYLLNTRLDEASPVLKKRIHYEVKRRVLDPAYHQNFGWMGFNENARRPNNWNPWIASNWLACNLLLEQDQEQRIKAIERILEVVDNFLNPHPQDGGCDEGPGYWNHAAGSLFDVLELMRVATDGNYHLYQQPIIKNMGSYIYKAYISHPYFLNFADANPQININGPHVYRYGEKIEDPKLMAFGAFGRDLLSMEEVLSEPNIARQLFLYAQFEEIYQHTATEILVKDAWLPDIEVMVARDSENTADGLYLAAKGGHNQESHNHNDIGNFVIYVDGEPAIIDAGRGTYTATTFSSKRYSLWFNNSSYHNVPQINGVDQPPGRAYEAMDVKHRSNNSSARLQMNMASAYPETAALSSWTRNIYLQRNRQVQVVDNYQATENPENIKLHLMTPCVTEKSGKNSLILRSIEDNRELLRINYKDLECRVEKLILDTPEDERIKEFWGEDLYRIILEDQQPGISGSYKVTFTKIK